MLPPLPQKRGRPVTLPVLRPGKRANRRLSPWSTEWACLYLVLFLVLLPPSPSLLLHRHLWIRPHLHWIWINPMKAKFHHRHGQYGRQDGNSRQRIQLCSSRIRQKVGMTKNPILILSTSFPLTIPTFVDTNIYSDLNAQIARCRERISDNIITRTFHHRLRELLREQKRREWVFPGSFFRNAV